MAENSKALGDWGENIAADYLKNKGYQILNRNWKNKWGEIDIVAEKNKVLVFVEVKTIKQQAGFAPEDKIDCRKKRQLAKMAQMYLFKHCPLLDTACQIDIIAIEQKPASPPQISHFANAVEDLI